MGRLMEVELDLYEMTTAANTGLLRVFESIKHNQSWGYNYSGSLTDQMTKSISGCLAEVAVAKYLKIPFEYHCNVGGVPDIIYKDLKIQVRSQLPKKNNSLIIRPKAATNEIYVYVLDRAPKFIIKGFINSSVVLGKDKYLTDFGLDRPKCFSIPLQILTPIFLLKDSNWN